MEINEERKDRDKIINAVKIYYEKHLSRKNNYKKGDRISYAGRCYDSKELEFLVDASLDFWLTSGRYVDEFENSFCKKLNVKHCSTVNSGSSANLIAFMALTSHLLGERAIKRGDEVITLAASFPTTVSPIVQFGAVPIFLDVTIPEYNIDINQLKKALTSKTKAVMIAHTLGNPFNIKAVLEFCKKNNLWLIEDNCDALGSKYTLDGNESYTGTFGDIATSSFYPPHHITMGEGGAVYTNNDLLHKIIRSLRDWGRDCVCPSGVDNLCKNRFNKKYGELPFGYDHKYVYSHFGYNLKITEMQAAVGLAQLEKLDSFIATRKDNFENLKKRLEDLQDYFILPKAEKQSSPSWFGFMLTCRKGVERNSVVAFLEKNNIQTRNLFAGNIVKQPCYLDNSDSIQGRMLPLLNTDTIMNNSFWIGVSPIINEDMIEFMAECLHKAVR